MSHEVFDTLNLIRGCKHNMRHPVLSNISSLPHKAGQSILYTGAACIDWTRYIPFR
jgi:hypothetical protein